MNPCVSTVAHSPIYIQNISLLIDGDFRRVFSSPSHRMSGLGTGSWSPLLPRPFTPIAQLVRRSVHKQASLGRVLVVALVKVSMHLFLFLQIVRVVSTPA